MNAGPAAKDIQDIGDARLWAVHHDAQISAWWEAQHEWNAKVEVRLDTFKDHTYARFGQIEDRVSKLEKRVIFASGVASALGALGGVLASVFLQTLGALE